MAKNDKKAAKDEGKKKAFGEREEYKYDVNTLAKDLGIEPASVRVALRKADVAKAGKSYGWDDKEDYEEVLETLQKGSKGGGKKDKDEERSSKKDKGKSGKGKAKDEDEDGEEKEERKPSKKASRR